MKVFNAPLVRKRDMDVFAKCHARFTVARERLTSLRSTVEQMQRFQMVCTGFLTRKDTSELDLAGRSRVYHDRVFELHAQLTRNVEEDVDIVHGIHGELLALVARLTTRADPKLDVMRACIELLAQTSAHLETLVSLSSQAGTVDYFFAHSRLRDEAKEDNFRALGDGADED